MLSLHHYCKFIWFLFLVNMYGVWNDGPLFYKSSSQPTRHKQTNHQRYSGLSVLYFFSHIRLHASDCANEWCKPTCQTIMSYRRAHYTIPTLIKLNRSYLRCPLICPTNVSDTNTDNLYLHLNNKAAISHASRWRYYRKATALLCTLEHYRARWCAIIECRAALLCKNGVHFLSLHVIMYWLIFI